MQSCRTSGNSYVSMYLIPPQTRLEEFWLVKPAKSPFSTNATLAPRAARAVAATAPLIPAPIINTSKVLPANFLTLLSLRFIKYYKMFA